MFEHVFHHVYCQRYAEQSISALTNVCWVMCNGDFSRTSFPFDGVFFWIWLILFLHFGIICDTLLRTEISRQRLRQIWLFRGWVNEVSLQITQQWFLVDLIFGQATRTTNVTMKIDLFAPAYLQVQTDRCHHQREWCLNVYRNRGICFLLTGLTFIVAWKSSSWSFSYSIFACCFGYRIDLPVKCRVF